jgi:hypothetical protein
MRVKHMRDVWYSVQALQQIKANIPHCQLRPLHLPCSHIHYNPLAAAARC